MKKPIIGFTSSFIGGILLGRYLLFPILFLYLSILALFSLSFFFYLKKREKTVTYLLFLLTFFIGIIYFYIRYYPSPSNIINFAPTSRAVEITGKVITHPQLKKGRKRRVTFIMEVKRIKFENKINKTEGKVWVNSYFPYKTCNYGDRVNVKGRLRIPRGARKKGEFNWQEYLSYQGVWAEVNTGKVNVIEKNRGNPILSLAYKSRDWMAGLIDKTLPFPHRSVLKGILLGDKESLPADTCSKWPACRSRSSYYFSFISNSRIFFKAYIFSCPSSSMVLCSSYWVSGSSSKSYFYGQYRFSMLFGRQTNFSFSYS